MFEFTGKQMQKKSGLIFILLLFFFSGCSTLQPGYEIPVVSITSFKALPTQGLIPQFQINLRIINPNRSSLDLKGISYTISLEGHKVMTGVSNKLPKIEAYGEGEVLLTASVDLFRSIKFFTDLVKSQNKNNIAYSLMAKLDAGTLHPLIYTTKKGQINLNQAIKKQ
jgi:LEA14-like dessication related protein